MKKAQMKADARADLKIIGDNNVSGGSYNYVHIIGDSIVNGNLDCLNLKTIGSVQINGNAKTDNAKIVGSISVSGSLESEDIRISGNIDTNADLKAKNISLKGGMDIKGGIKSDNIRLTGFVTIKKNCEAETFRSEGPLTIGGLLNADKIDIRIHSRCRISEIGGGKIRATRGHYSKLGRLIKSFLIPADFFKGKLVADSIEGDEIRLEDTKAKTVRGKTVVIGERCEIDLLEYSEECRIYGKSTVKEKKKIRKAE